MRTFLPGEVFLDATYSGARRAAILVALVYLACGSLVAPSLFSDAANGLLAWRGFQSGADFNTVVVPSESNLAQDRGEFLSWWSPGQYLAPGILELLGLSVGEAIVVTTSLAILACLLGWIRVVREFELGAGVAMSLVLLLATVRYSTLALGIYTGGEILLQAALPWMVLSAARISERTFARAAASGAWIVAIGFLAKLSGLMAAASILLAFGVMELWKKRECTRQLVGAAMGAVFVAILLQLLWFSKGATPTSGDGANFLAGTILAVLAPWFAGLGLMDLLTWLFLNPSHPVVARSSCLLWMLVPAAGIGLAILLCTRDWSEGARRLRTFTLLTAGAYLSALSFLFLRGTNLSIEERHVRPVGTLVLLCYLTWAVGGSTRTRSRAGFLLFCAFMSTYGIASYVYRASRTIGSGLVDRESHTFQPNLDREAIRLLRSIYEREGTSALFILPQESAIVLPVEARIKALNLDFSAERELATMRFEGAAAGTIAVVIPTDLFGGIKHRLLMSAFRDYDPAQWTLRVYSRATILLQSRRRPG